MSLVAPAKSIAYREDAEFDGLRMGNAVDSWIRAMHFGDTTNSVAVTTGAAKNFAFSCNGSQVLFDRISGNGNSVFYFATQARQQGPVVLLHGTFQGDGRIEPHQRWSTGLLVDECEVPGGGISLQNRGTMGSGHGWTIGWSVLWNNRASSILVQTPPGVANWSIGDRGWQHTNVFAAGRMIATYDYDATGQSAGNLHFQLSDWLGNRRVQTNYAGFQEQLYGNSPFGDHLSNGYFPGLAMLRNNTLPAKNGMQRAA